MEVRDERQKARDQQNIIRFERLQ